jgi:hypothetical protein
MKRRDVETKTVLRALDLGHGMLSHEIINATIRCFGDKAGTMREAATSSY